MLGSLLFMQKAYVGGIDGGYAMIGLFPHKNVLGMRMLVLIIAALVIILDSRYEQIWRLAALAVVPPAIFLLLGSNSATALVLLVACGLIVVSLGGFWRPAARVRGLRLILVAGMVVITAAGSLYVANAYRINPYTAALERLDKDSTLTGRTEIWRIGNQVIEQNPILGVGAGAFWRPGVSRATQIATIFQAEGNKFWFHNAYYEATVHLGFIGVIIFLVTIGRAYWVLLTDWLRRQDLLDSFFVTIAAMLFVRTFTESELFSVFLLNPMIFWTGVFMALRSQAQRPKY